MSWTYNPRTPTDSVRVLSFPYPCARTSYRPLFPKPPFFIAPGHPILLMQCAPSHLSHATVSDYPKHPPSLRSTVSCRSCILTTANSLCDCAVIHATPSHGQGCTLQRQVRLPISIRRLPNTACPSLHRLPRLSSPNRRHRPAPPVSPVVPTLCSGSSCCSWPVTPYTLATDQASRVSKSLILKAAITNLNAP